MLSWGFVMKLGLVNVFDSLSRQTKVIIVNGKTYVAKDYASEVGLLKWYAITLSNIAVRKYPFKLEPVDRMKREVTFMRSPTKCFKKPEVLLVDYGRLRLIREFVKGELYSYNAPCHVHIEIGRSLGQCHDEGWVLGDTKITNFVYSGNEVYIVDAEQATKDYRPEHAAWDLLVLVSTLFMENVVMALKDIEMSARYIDLILNGYLEGNRGSGLDSLKTLLATDFKLLAYLLIPFPLNYVFTRKVEERVEKAY